eukprot:7517734-Pyramimonas_sp.AAC.2
MRTFNVITARTTSLLATCDCCQTLDNYYALLITAAASSRARPDMHANNRYPCQLSYTRYGGRAGCEQRPPDAHDEVRWSTRDTTSKQVSSTLKSKPRRGKRGGEGCIEALTGALCCHKEAYTHHGSGVAYVSPGGCSRRGPRLKRPLARHINRHLSTREEGTTTTTNAVSHVHRLTNAVSHVHRLTNAVTYTALQTQSRTPPYKR